MCTQMHKLKSLIPKAHISLYNILLFTIRFHQSSFYHILDLALVCCLEQRLALNNPDSKKPWRSLTLALHNPGPGFCTSNPRSGRPYRLYKVEPPS